MSIGGFFGRGVGLFLLFFHQPTINFYSSTSYIYYALKVKLLIFTIYLLKSNKHFILEWLPVSTAKTRRQWILEGLSFTTAWSSLNNFLAPTHTSLGQAGRGWNFSCYLSTSVLITSGGLLLSAPFDAQPYYTMPWTSCFTVKSTCSQSGYIWHARTSESTALKLLCDVLHCKSESLSVFKPVKCRGNLNNDSVMGAGGCSTCWMFILLLTAYTFILQYMKQ